MMVSEIFPKIILSVIHNNSKIIVFNSKIHNTGECGDTRLMVERHVGHGRFKDLCTTWLPVTIT